MLLPSAGKIAIVFIIWRNVYASFPFRVSVISLHVSSVVVFHLLLDGEFRAWTVAASDLPADLESPLRHVLRIDPQQAVVRPLHHELPPHLLLFFLPFRGCPPSHLLAAVACLLLVGHIHFLDRRYNHTWMFKFFFIRLLKHRWWRWYREDSSGDDKGSNDYTGEDSGVHGYTGDDSGINGYNGDDSGIHGYFGDDGGIHGYIGDDSGIYGYIGNDTYSWI